MLVAWQQQEGRLPKVVAALLAQKGLAVPMAQREPPVLRVPRPKVDVEPSEGRTAERAGLREALEYQEQTEDEELRAFLRSGV